ncbi:MAG: ABC transporter permease, partial [Candidatus Hodarchaeota archaeon]
MQGIDVVLIGWILKTTLQMSAPLMLAALGGMFSERSGVVNIALEGIMLMGAFTAVLATDITGNPWIGVLASMIGGGILGLLHAIICVKFKGDHIVSGTGILLFAAGFTTMMVWVVWGIPGVSAEITNPLPPIELPWLAGIPIIGTAFEALSPIVYMAFVLVIVCWYVLYKTSFGLRVRASGEDPSTLDTAGVNVETIRILAVTISGLLGGLGGAYLSIAYGTRFGMNMTAGKGFIALAALIFGNWTPVGVLLASVFFGFLIALRLAIDVHIPELVQFNSLIK